MENEQPQPTTPPDVSELQAKLDSLQHLVVSILLLLIVVTGTFWIFLMRQVRTTGVDLAGFRAQATNVIAAYEKSDKPAMDSFIDKLREFGRTNPDFAPYLAKWGLTNVATAQTGRSPAAAPKAKK